MITIKDVRTLDGQVSDFTIPSDKDHLIDAKKKLFLLPGIIDPHFSCGEPGSDSCTFPLQNAVKGGITNAIITPSCNYPCNTQESLVFELERIDKKLSHLGLPLNVSFYAKGDPKRLEELGKIKKQIKGILIAPDEKKKEALDDEWERVFQLAAWENLPIIVNACQNEDPTINLTLLEKAIDLAERQSNRLFVLNVSNQHELNLIREARKRSLLVYAETTPNHLFSDHHEQTEGLWEALNNREIETIGTGSLTEKTSRLIVNGGNYGLSDPIYLLPLLLTASLEGKISLEKIVRLLKINILDILAIQPSNDYLLVDLEQEQNARKITDGHAVDIKLRGWPIYSIVNGIIVDCQ